MYFSKTNSKLTPPRLSSVAYSFLIRSTSHHKSHFINKKIPRVRILLKQCYEFLHSVNNYSPIK